MNHSWFLLSRFLVIFMWFFFYMISTFNIRPVFWLLFVNIKKKEEKTTHRNALIKWIMSVSWCIRITLNANMLQFIPISKYFWCKESYSSQTTLRKRFRSFEAGSTESWRWCSFGFPVRIKFVQYTIIASDNATCTNVQTCLTFIFIFINILTILFHPFYFYDFSHSKRMKKTCFNFYLRFGVIAWKMWKAFN